MARKTQSTAQDMFETSPAFRTLSLKLKKELEENPQDEGEIFSILDLLLFSLESEEQLYIGDLNTRVTTSLLDSLLSFDAYVGYGFFRKLKLFFFGPSFLAYILSIAKNLHDAFAQCNKAVKKTKYSHLVHFVHKSGASYTTPVIQKWLDVRQVKISKKEWELYQRSAK